MKTQLLHRRVHEILRWFCFGSTPLLDFLACTKLSLCESDSTASRKQCPLGLFALTGHIAGAAELDREKVEGLKGIREGEGLEIPEHDLQMIIVKLSYASTGYHGIVATILL